jgi:CRP-like cAMP-binding protein
MADEAMDPRDNQVLGKLDDDELARIEAVAERVDVEVRDPVYDRGGPIEDVYLPLSAVYSYVAQVEADVAVEVATIGREGFVGLPVFLGARSSAHTAFCQIAGVALRVAARDFVGVTNSSPAIRARATLYTQAFIVQVAQNTACNRIHTTEERAARWLLMTQDRTQTETFALTQDFLAQMLGVRRPTVSLTAGMLQSAGLIRYTRGNITIVDRPALEDAACECYAIVRDEFNRLLG